MSEPNFYRQDKPAIAAVTDRQQVLEAELAAAYARWELLEGLRK